MIARQLALGVTVSWNHIMRAIWNLDIQVLAALLAGVPTLSGPEFGGGAQSLLLSALRTEKDAPAAEHVRTHMLLAKGLRPTRENIRDAVLVKDSTGTALLLDYFMGLIDGFIMELMLRDGLGPEALQAALRHGSNTNGMDPIDGKPHLYRALELADLTKARMLLQAAADPNVCSYHRESTPNLALKRLDRLYLIMEFGQQFTPECRSEMTPTQRVWVDTFVLRPAFMMFWLGSREAGLLPEIIIHAFVLLLQQMMYKQE